jgi:hypothetical protein
MEHNCSKLSTSSSTASSVIATDMCLSPAAQVSEAVAIISATDFPAKWPKLLPELMQHITSPDYTVVIGVLKTANEIFKRCGCPRRGLLSCGKTENCTLGACCNTACQRRAGGSLALPWQDARVRDSLSVLAKGSPAHASCRMT